MQFEDFDKKIIDAAEHHHPAYEEKAWEKMETLLDKHLPTKKDDRRRIIFFLFLFLLLGSGTFLLFRNNGQTNTLAIKKQNREESAPTKSSSLSTGTNSDKSAEKKVIDKEAAKAGKISSSESKDVNGGDDNVSAGNNNDKNGSAGSNIAQTKSNNITSGIKENSRVVKSSGKITKQQVNKENVARNKTGFVPGKSLTKENTAGNSPRTHIITDEKSQTDMTSQADASLSSPITSADTILTGATPKSETAINPGTDTADQKKSIQQVARPGEKDSSLIAKKKNNKKAGKQKQSAFAITFTTGPDLSFISLSELGKVKMKYGAGLSYSYKRFTLRSGFYVTNKIYSAGGSAYHPYYPNLETVDGDCKVYEIPLSINYNFLQAKNHNWFASTGLSSYLMKKETYEYLSKDPVTGMTDYYAHTWNNKNKHYFSVLNLSAGYERKFTKVFSLIAEPYLQIPLTGIGNGKMKLNSAGLLFTLSVKPFAARK